MAPFNTHFLIAEKVWPDLPAGPWRDFYGQFCFGCVAPDVDKASKTLTQKDTHFFDRTGDYEAMALRRTAAFLARQDTFLHRPFARLSPDEQAFALGYLCHLAVDEVSKHIWRRETWRHFFDIMPTSAFAALDELARQQTGHYAEIAEALCMAKPVNVIPHIPPPDLVQMHRGVCDFVQATDAEAEYLALVDLFNQPTLEQRYEYRRCFRAEINLARERVHFFKLDKLLQAGRVRSHQRLLDLIEGRVPEPSYPVLNNV